MAPPTKAAGGADDPSFPGLKPAAPDAAGRIAYDELQQNEVLALEAIYGDDFVKHSGAHSAWKKTEPSFDIRIKASTDSDFAVTVGFVMTATYPKTPPLLTLKGLGKLREPTQRTIANFIDTQPKLFCRVEQEMIDKIVEGIRDILEDAAQAKASDGPLPSLEQERELHEAQLAERAQRRQEQQEERRLQEKQAEERAMSEQLQQHLEHQRQRAKESRQVRRSESRASQPTQSSKLDAEHIDFGRYCELTDKSGSIITFRSVAGKCDRRHGHVSAVYTVRPVLVGGQSSQTLALKEAVLSSDGKEPKELKEQVQTVESRLQRLKSDRKMHHRHLVDILDFKVEGGLLDDDAAAQIAWNMRILTPLADKGSLEELLELAGHLDISKVRSWTRDLLDALNFLHNKNIAHQDIHAGNILLFRESTGEVVPKISDAWYQRGIHNAHVQKQGLPGLNTASSAYWLPPEIAGVQNPQYTFKTDIWEFGVVFIQTIFGLDVLQTYASPKDLMKSLVLSHSLQELVGSFFTEEKQKRPRAFELGASEFLATDAPVLLQDSPAVQSALPPLTPTQAYPVRLRRGSTNPGASVSRYTEDFVEEGRLGKGGFGEVVKARKKLDGQIYAIKKITQRSNVSLTETLKEVRLLSQLSHPAVVRYYNTWVEEVAVRKSAVDDSTDDEDGETSREHNTKGASEVSGIEIQFTESAGASETGETSGDKSQFAASAGALDFMSSNASDVFGYDDDSGDESEEDACDDDEINDNGDDGNRPVSSGTCMHTAPSRSRTVLYISMEYCEKRTLRDLISRNLCKNTPEIWRLFRQILEGLAHIHALSIVHRDLKPENIFISSGIDGADNVKIGDFGLATSGQFSVDKTTTSTLEADDMTRSIGTAYYSAPEVRSAADGGYSTKVDMYSLGILFFEMCYPPMLGMEKADVITKLRQPEPVLPSDFKPAEKTLTDIVLSLVNHSPKERPSASELLESGMLPVQMESETIRRTLAGLSDPSSPYYAKMLSTLFSRPLGPAKDYAWDMSASPPDASELLHQGFVKSTLTSIFRRHGALETPRNPIYPRSRYYGDSVVRLLDPNGTVVQLPYDLTLGHARTLAKHASVVQRSFAFGSVYRDRRNAGQPKAFGEVDFDIVTNDALDLALKEAEVFKVLDEIIHAFPSLSSSQMCFHIGHSDLLQMILEHCGVAPACRRAVADVLSKLNIHGHGWQKIREELRSAAVGVSATSIQELARFDFRDAPNKAFSKLSKILEGADTYQRAAPTIAHIKEVVEYMKRFGVSTRVYVNPLNSLNEGFFAGGILFSCLYERRSARDVFAAGGRYDHLIKEQRLKIGGRVDERHAVGFSLAWERLAKVPEARGKALSSKKREHQSEKMFPERRCLALVASLDAALLRSAGIEMLQQLWAHGISAELAKDARSAEDLLSKHRDEGHLWIIMIKQDSMLKIKTVGKSDVADVDIASTQLLAWLRPQMRERESRAARLSESSSSAAAAAAAAAAGGDKDTEQEVKVLVAQAKSKKFNRQAVVEQAQASAGKLVRSFLDGPVLAVETTDQAMEVIKRTSLSDHESWRKAEQAVATSEKRYVRELHEQLEAWQSAHLAGEGTRHSFIYNFRTGTCLYYDLGN